MIVPSVYVNNVVQRGGLSAANVLSSICAGYLEGTQPEVCGCVSATPDQVVACVKSGNYHPLPPGTKVTQQDKHATQIASSPRRPGVVA